MPTKTELENWELLSHKELDSTNKEARRHIDSNFKSNIVIISDSQTSGKGQHGRKWVSPAKTGLYGSWIIEDLNIEPGLLSLSTAYCCVKTIEELFKLPTKIKWVNDIFISDKKLGGILIEKYKDFFILGIGINILNHETIPQTSTTIKNHIQCSDFESTRKDLVIKLSEKISLLKINPPSIKDIEKNLTFQKGEEIKIVKDSVLIKGIYKGLNSDGSLNLG